jgi:Icc-related predicted phosphoesterase
MANIIVYMTDIHGDVELCEKLLEAARGRNVGAVIMGGDITPFTQFILEGNIQNQREFLQEYLIPRLELFKKEVGKPVFLMMGNDDFMVNIDVLNRAEENGVVKVLHNKTHKLFGFDIVGYSFVNPTPFMIKDWEKNEVGIKKELEKLTNGCKPGKFIFVSHAPPFRTKLDMLYDGSHVGSTAIRHIIEKKKPYLSLHGHIHESHYISSSPTDRINETMCINPGSGKLTVVDLDNLKQVVVAD